MARNGSNWSSLPEDLLAIIAKRLLLHSVDEILRFRAVCRSFRSSSSIVYPPKSLIPRSSFRIYFSIDSTPGNGSNFVLTKSTIYAIQPLDRISDSPETPWIWMVRIEESKPGKVRINDPMTGCRLKNSKNLSNELPRSLNLLDYRVKEIVTAYRLELATLGKRKSRSKSRIGVCRNEMHKVVPKFFWKVVVSEFVDGFAVMAIHSGLTVAVDYKSLSITQVENPLQDAEFRAQYLVKSFTDLFMIAANPLRWKFYKLDEVKCEWVPVMNQFEDTVWFAGNDWSFSVSAKEFFGFEGSFFYINSVLGFRHTNEYPGQVYCPGIGTRICDLKNDVSYPARHLLSKIFWPPPTWVKKHSGSVPSRSHTGRRGS